MRTSLNDLREAESFVEGKMAAGDSLLFQARLVVHPLMRLNLACQQKAYSLIKLFARKQLKAEIEVVHARIFNDPAKAEYSREIRQLFAKPNP